MENATEQFYYEYLGLNGYYQVEMTGDDGIVYRSCVYEMRPTEGLEETAVLPVWSEGEAEIYTMDGRRCVHADGSGIYLIRWHDGKTQIQIRKILIP